MRAKLYNRLDHMSELFPQFHDGLILGFTCADETVELLLALPITEQRFTLTIPKVKSAWIENFRGGNIVFEFVHTDLSSGSKKPGMIAQIDISIYKKNEQEMGWLTSECSSALHIGASHGARCLFLGNWSLEELVMLAIDESQ